MRQVCPHCAKTVELDTAASEAPCPACGTAIRVPATYAVAVDPAAVTASPPPPVPPTPPARPPVRAATPSQAVPAPPPGFAAPSQAVFPPAAGYGSSFPITLSPPVLPWVVAGGFVLIFLLWPFPWAGSYPGGTTAYTQSLWGTLGNGFGTVTAVEQEFKQESLLEKGLRSDWWLVLPYVAVVLAGLALAIADRFVTAPDFAYRIGPLGTVRALVWPRRPFILLGLAGAALLLFAFVSARGLGLEAAMTSVAAANHAEALAKPDLSSADRERIQTRTALDLARFGKANGLAWWLAGLAHVAVAGAAALHLGLERRGDRPPPRAVLEW
jgi:hypothetical protein